MLTVLRDGAFSGEIVLDSSSPAKSVIIRIRDYRLEFYVPGEYVTSERPTRPHFVGAVSMPIYVDPSSVAFSLSSSGTDDGVHRLLVDGRMKGCGAEVRCARSRRLSMSASDLSLLASSASARRTTGLDQW